MAYQGHLDECSDYNVFEVDLEEAQKPLKPSIRPPAVEDWERISSPTPQPIQCHHKPRYHDVRRQLLQSNQNSSQPIIPIKTTILTDHPTTNILQTYMPPRLSTPPHKDQIHQGAGHPGTGKPTAQRTTSEYTASLSGCRLMLIITTSA